MFDLVFTIEADDQDEAYEVRDFILKTLSEDGRYLVVDVEVYDA